MDQDLTPGTGDVDSKDKSGNTPLHLASLSGYPDAVRTLIMLGSDIHARNVEGETPLHFAADEGHVDVVKILLDSGADPDLLDSHGATPCHLAAAGNHMEAMELLSKRSNRTGVIDMRERMNQLHMAAEKGWTNLLEDLIALKLPVNEKNNRGETALYATIRRGHDECAEMLLEAGADPTIPRDDGSTILHAAATSGMVSIIGKLIITNRKSNRAAKALHGESNERTDTGPRKDPVKHWQDIYELCEKMVLPDSDGHGNNSTECEHQLPALEEYLTTLFHPDTSEDKLNDLRRNLQEVLHNLDISMDVNTNLGRGTTLIHLAAICDSVQTVRGLMKRGANIKARNLDGMTPLIMACAGGSLEAVDALVMAGADTNDVDNCGRTGLHYATRLKSLGITRYLLGERADPNRKDINGNTPLHIAAAFGGGPPFAITLRTAGGDLLASNNQRLFPFSLARDPISFKILQPPGYNFDEMITPFS